jgi:single-stranded DNA-binding protein
MNYTNFLIRVISQPERSIFNVNNEDIIYAEFIAKFYQYRNNSYTLCKIKVWGNLAYDVLRYYNKNDFLMVEGSLSTENSTFEKLDINTSINITASKIYPFALTKKTK